MYSWAVVLRLLISSRYPWLCCGQASPCVCVVTCSHFMRKPLQQIAHFKRLGIDLRYSTHKNITVDAYHQFRIILMKSNFILSFLYIRCSTRLKTAENIPTIARLYSGKTISRHDYCCTVHDVWQWFCILWPEGRIRLLAHYNHYHYYTSLSGGIEHTKCLSGIFCLVCD